MKPSQATPLTTIHLIRLLEEAGVPKGVVNLVLGPGKRVGQALAESPDVDLVSFTGSLAGGKSIMAAALRSTSSGSPSSSAARARTSCSPTPTSRPPSTTR